MWYTNLCFTELLS